MNCLLSTLGNAKLTNPLPGIRLDAQGELTLIAPLFSCCHGEGLAFATEAAAYRRCDLQPRLQALRQILARFKQLWGFALTSQHLTGQRPPANFQSWLIAMQEDQGLGKGQAFTSDTPLKQPSYPVWLMALTSAWKLGLDVHVVSLGRSKADTLLPPPQFGLQRRGVVFLEQKDPLWRPQTAFDFDTLINWCEGALLPLWFDVLTTAAPVPPSDDDLSLNIKQAMQRKINRLKQRPALAWLGPASNSRLREVCGGSEQFF